MVYLMMLGTSSQFPTKQRNHSSIFFRFNKFKALLDCGEGTQRQLRIKKISPHQLDALFISHWHGDHTLGIGGIIQSMSASNREKSLKIFGPIGTKDRIHHIMKTYIFKKTFNVEVFEVRKDAEEMIFETDEFTFYSFPLKHGIDCNGYYCITKSYRRINLDYTKKFGLTKHPLLGKLQKGEDILYDGKKITVKKATIIVPGKKITYIADTKFFNDLVKYSKDSDLLICEATFSKKDENKCKDYNHMSTVQAASIAKKGKSKKLVMTHLSQRYYNTKDLEDEARKVFKESVYAKDFDEYEIK